MLNIRSFWIALVVLALASCATKDEKRVGEAVTAPLNDLNLVHAKIPQVLQQAQRGPYSVPKDYSCESLAADIAELDAALGTDLDAQPSESNPGLIERASDETKNSMFNRLRDTAESVVPYKAWVRKLSGAERYSKKVAAAIAAGTVRRAFLKGLRVSKECGGAQHT